MYHLNITFIEQYIYLVFVYKFLIQFFSMQILKVNKVYLSFFAIVGFMLHLPFAFSGTKIFSFNKIAAVAPTITSNNSSSYKIYDSLKLNLSGLSQQAFTCAVKGYEYLKLKGKIGNDNILSITFNRIIESSPNIF